MIKILKNFFFIYRQKDLNTLIFKILIKFIKFFPRKKIIINTKKKVVNGYYKNIELSCKQVWNSATPSQLLGFYEEQVQKKIINLKKKFDLDFLVNFGAAEGYHAVGLIKNKHFKKCFAFEIDPKNQNHILNNLKLNKIENKVKIFGEANFKEVKKNLNIPELKKTLFLVDIEGDEFNLFNKKNLKFFKNNILIIENHEMLISKKNKINDFFELMKQNFTLEILENSSRNPFLVKEIKYLDDDEKWLMMSESRPFKMNWLVFIPKKLISKSVQKS